MKPILAIDPGANGGLAWITGDGQVQAVPMPDGMAETIDSLRELRCTISHMTAYMEQVGTYMPGNSGPSAAKFARHCGHLEAALYALGIPTVFVLPVKWQKAIGGFPADKAERKRAIKEAMARRYPHLTVTLKTADALGILTYAIQAGGVA
jgi:hypothetical protein